MLQGEKEAKTWGMLTMDAVRSRITTIIVSAVGGAILGVYGTIVTIQPQLISVTAKVAAIESTYVTKTQFESFEDKEQQRWADQDTKLDQLISILKK